MNQAFFALVNAGLWEKEVRLEPYGAVDFSDIYRLACEQQVVGLVAAGIEHVVDTQVGGETLALFESYAHKLEQRNQAMNQFIARLYRVFNRNNVPVILVKGQGIAQCYERPLWRAIGDIDLLIDKEHYKNAKTNMMAKADSVNEEDDRRLHVALVMGPWVVELHGTLNHKFLTRVNRVLGEVQNEVHQHNAVRLWNVAQSESRGSMLTMPSQSNVTEGNNEGVDIPLPAYDEDVIFIFSHILEHFFGKGVGLRQICDWCRLLYTYRDFIDRRLLEERLRRMGIMSEWKAFAAFAVENLDMPHEFMPLYSTDRKWSRKAGKIKYFILKYGNLGHNRDMSYIFKASFLKKKAISLRDRIDVSLRLLRIFPKDTLIVWHNKTLDSVSRAARGV